MLPALMMALRLMACISPCQLFPDYAGSGGRMAASPAIFFRVAASLNTQIDEFLKY